MDTIVSSVLNSLKNLVLNDMDLTTTLKTELYLLEIEFDRMKTFLEDTSNRRLDDELFQYWEKEIREVIYELEDTIAAYFCQQAAETRSITSRIIKRLKLGHSTIDDQLKMLRESKVKPLFFKAQIDLAKLPAAADVSQTSPAGTKDMRKKDPREDLVVGFEDETNTLIESLIQDSDKLEIVSIIGMPGLGKTTVAWKIYQDQRIKYEFPTTIWLYVSQEFNKKGLFLTILKKFTQLDMSRKSAEQLAQQVKDHLSRRKFLIIMDDVWSAEAWNEIKVGLPMANKMGKILLTSRDENVARHVNAFREPHKLRFLTPEESWELLQLRVAGKLDTMDKSLENIGRVIADKCSGLPLSIDVMGGILIDTLSTSGGRLALKKKWEKVSESVPTYLIHEDKNNLLQYIISLSYKSLPYCLRHCFLYLGVFPEDYEISAGTLIRLWIAENFIQEKPGKIQEEVAQNYLKDLIKRSLIMVHRTNPEGEVKTCRVHDMIREFCKNEASHEKQNLFQEIQMSKQGYFEPLIENIAKFRRISIHSHVHSFLESRPNVGKIRTFLSFSKAPIILQNRDASTIPDNFSLIRIFAANSLVFPMYPDKISQLLHLKYLTLSVTGINVLPRAITELQNLQTLTVNTSSRTLEIKGDIWKMMSLRHLKTKSSVILIKGGKGEGGRNLQTLGNLSSCSCSEDIFNKAKNLIKLTVRGELSNLSKFVGLENLSILKTLKLIHDAYPKVSSENPMSGLPQPHTFPPQLRTLILCGTFLDWLQMCVVGQLGRLEVLKLKDNAFTGSFWEVTAGGFHTLEFLYIETTNLTCWTAGADSFPRLKKLVLKNCEKLQGVPLEVQENLDMLSVDKVTTCAISWVQHFWIRKKKKGIENVVPKSEIVLPNSLN